MIKVNKPFLSSIKGVFFVKGHEALQSVSVGDQLLWEREPDNRYDKNAIIVMNSKREKIGYLPKEVSKDIVAMMSENEIKALSVVVNQFNSTERNQSCNIMITCYDNIERL